MENYEKSKFGIFPEHATPEIGRLDPTDVHKCEIERRRDRRISTDDCASMKMLNPAVDGRQAIRVLDVSRSGLKLSSYLPLERGTLVQVYFGNIVAMGEVRHCVKCGAEFHAGVQLDNVFRRQPDQESEEHVFADQRT